VKCNKKGVLSLGWIEFAYAHLLDEGGVCESEIINVEDQFLRVHTVFRVLDIIDRERQDEVKALLKFSHLDIKLPMSTCHAFFVATNIFYHMIILLEYK
jgi:hypothetical protein